MTVKVGVIGASGRMGRAIAEVLEGSPHAVFAGGTRRDNPVADLANACDVLVDFSAPDALDTNLQAAIAAKRAIVVGTTGLQPTQHNALASAAAFTPVLQSANMSLGVNLLAHLVEQAAARLGPDWDVEIVEMHHRHKQDAPSGTALLLGEAAARGRSVDLANVADRGRDGITGPRREGAIGFAALRGGSVAGDHQVILAGEGERLELGHRAESRLVFARGAVQAAIWLHGQPPGRYTMRDVLGLP